MRGILVPWLADAARLTGYPVVEVAGYKARGHGGFRALEVVVGHHTADGPSGNYPSLNIVTKGRSDLPGPLCNYGLGRDGTVYVVAAGVAWHAGASRWAGFNDLNDESIGIEAEATGVTPDCWTAVQRDAYPRLVAACLHFMRRDASRFAGHKEVCIPKGRKIDPAYWDLNDFRARVAWLLADPLNRIPRNAPAQPAPAPQEDEVMNAAQEARLVRVEKALEIIVQQVCGEAATIEKPFPGEAAKGGWEGFPGGTPGRRTLVDGVRTLDVDVQKLKLHAGA